MPFRYLLPLVLLLPAAAAATDTVSNPLAQALSRAAPAANPKVLALATRALACVQRSMPAQTLSVIDYSLPSTTPRLWVFGLGPHPHLLFHELVAHGRNSGDNLADRFSNQPGSLMSSLGTFVTDGTYTGHNGYSLRLKGIDGNFNDQAESRAIVIHGAHYVSEAFARSQGRLGRSWGCPAVRAGVAHKLIDAIAAHSVVFAYYPDPRWLQGSRVLGDCGGNEVLSSR
ncbi:L,D-transpeptidase catalytic domain [Frateuria terrea]|uniref:L,D-transpeptidase catalytic domain n=1 Tax=Frateuria terrea TaxID=529704 RepID=A0A1H6URH7_9GAMM|nr:L,D-transpeptidase catalytic domain [Frateuria terrea]SFP33619.1 L,D-transpeptidase catalytic domain [Frateuria terrea]